LSMNTLPVLLMFHVRSASDHSPGNLCRYAKGRLRSHKWMWGAFSPPYVWWNSIVVLSDTFHDNWPHWMDRNSYTSTIQTLLE
jgi:hypothetical protein